MLSFKIKGNKYADAIKVLETLKVFTLAESLGGVESLIEVPAAMTHASTAGSPLEVDPGLVRLSVGLEHVDDLLEDLENRVRLPLVIFYPGEELDGELRFLCLERWLTWFFVSASGWLLLL